MFGYRIPFSAQDTIPYRQITTDGIVEIEKGVYSKSVVFNDVNYQIARNEDKEELFLKYCSFLNFFDSSLNLQITINNRNISREKDILLKRRKDKYDVFRGEYNKIMEKQFQKGKNDISREKYLTYTARAKNINEARETFIRYDESIHANFKRMGSKSFELAGIERLRILYDFFNNGKEELFDSNIEKIIEQGIITKDIIAPESFKFKTDYFMIGDKYARVLFIKTFPSYINDRFIAEMADFNLNMMLTINIKPVEIEKAVKIIKKQITGMEGNKIEYQKRALKSGYSQDILPVELQHSLEQASELLNDMLNKNQKMFLVNILFLHTANSIDELNKDTDIMMATARKYLCCMGKLKYQQEDAMVSTLPLGKNKLKIQRTLTTESTAVFIPFTSREVFQKDGMYYGISNISKNVILFNRKSLKNPNGFTLGTPGSGKSFSAKKEIVNILLNTEDDIIILDPEAEYMELVKNFDGEIINMSPNSKHHINPLDINEQYSGDDEPISIKSEFILSLCECFIGGKNGLTAKERTIIDRCLKKAYLEFLKGFDASKIPTLVDFYEILASQLEPAAKEVALSLEIYAKGSLSIFAKKTNVNYNSRLVSYNIKDLGKQLKTVGMLVVLDNVWNRITRNRKVGKRTWIYIDEAHVLFKNDYSANFLHELYKRARKWGAISTCITQNVSELLVSEQAKTMLSNSDFLLLFNQSASDRKELSELLKISKTQMGYITGSEAGQGLLFTSDFVIPFMDKFPENTNLYKMMTTKPDEASV